MKIDGEKIADFLLAELKKKPRPKKYLAVIQVGDEPTMVSFVRKKEEAAKELGVRFQSYRNPVSIGLGDLKKEVLEKANDPDCGGIVLQLPLPEQIDRNEIIAAIPPEKDVDNLTGKAPVLSPAAGVVEEILRTYGLRLTTLKVVVVGQGLLVGKPISNWLKGKCAEIHSLSAGDDLSVLKQADIIISGVGKAGLIKPEMLKEKAMVIDFGYDLKDERLSGDFDLESLVSSHKSPVTYTPTPGGTGPVLVAKLFENFYKLTSRL